MVQQPNSKVHHRVTGSPRQNDRRQKNVNNARHKMAGGVFYHAENELGTIKRTHGTAIGLLFLLPARASFGHDCNDIRLLHRFAARQLVRAVVKAAARECDPRAARQPSTVPLSLSHFLQPRPLIWSPMLYAV